MGSNERFIAFSFFLPSSTAEFCRDRYGTLIEGETKIHRKLGSLLQRSMCTEFIQG
jgi:hypothetical protein